MNQTEAKTKQLLQIDSKYLDPTFEIKQMFGSKVFQADGKPNRGQQQQRRASMRSKRVTPAKRTFLVKPREYWPQAADGQTMELVETKKGINYFKFNWSNTYKDIQRQFFGCVQTGDPNTLAAVRVKLKQKLNEEFELTLVPYPSSCSAIHTTSTRSYNFMRL
jgi:hypothetical protein